MDWFGILPRRRRSVRLGRGGRRLRTRRVYCDRTDFGGGVAPGGGGSGGGGGGGGQGQGSGTSGYGHGGFVQADDARRRSMADAELPEEVFGRYSIRPSASSLSSSVDENYLNMYGYLRVMASTRRPTSSPRPSRGLFGRFRAVVPFSRQPEPDFYGDQMTYEDILALEEWMGTVPMGVPDQVLKQLKVKPVRSQEEHDGCCPICLSNYQPGEKLRELHCAHAFHVDCVDIWFKEKNTCPVCKADVAS